MIRPLLAQDPGEDRDKRALSLVIRDFRDYFSNTYVLKWSLWWALGMCGNFQVLRKI